VAELYGRSAAPIDEQVKIMAIGDDEPITGRPADLLEPELEKLKKELGTDNIEDVLSYALFPHVARTYFDERDGKVIDKGELAAIAIAFAARFLKLQDKRTSRTQTQSREYKPGPWAMAGRLDLMNARGRNI
jgi:pyruvate/oxaloacetate carboxyltransferase